MHLCRMDCLEETTDAWNCADVAMYLLRKVGCNAERTLSMQAAKFAGEDIRPEGSDIKVGQTVLQRGELLGAAEIGILATVGAAQLQVHAVNARLSRNPKS